jgi:hypothetical protein
MESVTPEQAKIAGETERERAERHVAGGAVPPYGRSSRT